MMSPKSLDFAQHCMGANSFPWELTSNERRNKIENGRFASPESEPIYFK